MNRNDDAHFSNLPKVNIQRSLFDRSCQHKTTFNVGDLVPIYVDEYVPADTFSVDTAFVMRTTTLLKPVMDNMYADIFYFSVPNRLLWEHWQEFMGENTSGPWSQTTEYVIPQTTAPTGGWDEHCIPSYMGIPTKVSGITISSLYLRAYCLIYNEFFRDENLQNFTDFVKTDSNTSGSIGTNKVTDPIKGGKVLKVCKMHDYFTSCLPDPQKGPDVLLPLGETAPVITTEDTTANLAGTKMKFQNISTNIESSGTLQVYQGGVLTNGSAGSVNSWVKPANLWTDLSSATASKVNDLIEAFAIQALYVNDARGGTRYTELIKSHFGVTSPDARLQRPEYLGGKRVPINNYQVIQTSGTQNAGTQVTPQGNLSAFSHTTDVDGSFTKSFTEHGIIIGLMCVRTEKTYQQGIERMFSRKRRFDFYWPELANLGEQEVLNKEIMAQGTATDNEVFGYQERWGEYRHKMSRVSGQMRSNATGSMDYMHYAEDYETLPSLSDEWIEESPNNVDRTLAVAHTTADQIQVDIDFKVRCARPMPTYSIPSLMTHF